MKTQSVRKLFGITLLAFLVAAGCASVPPSQGGDGGSKTLTGEEIKTLLVGTAVTYKAEGFVVSVTYLPDGKTKSEWNGPYGRGQDKGTWRITGKEICTTWQQMKPSCRGVQLDGKGNRIFVSGSERMFFELER